MSKIAKITAKNQHENNTGFGWKSRKKMQISYPESLAIEVLNELDIKYEREYRISKYFIDFVIHDKKIAIEIDGQQHKINERKLIDNKKDDLLKKNGWTVYRISYPEQNIKNIIRSILTDIPSH